jgi:hypothetical protein
MSRFASAITSIASTGRTHRTGIALVPKLLLLSAICCATTIAGCASHSDRQAAQSCRPMKALLEPQPAPDCEFRGSDPKTVDPDEFARLKLDYERQCYRRAEKLARERLRLLQASKQCGTRPVRHSPAAIR